MSANRGKSTEGVLYTAIGEAFVEEAATSANRLRELDIDYPTAIITDQDAEHDCFDHVLSIDRDAQNRQDWLKARLDNLDRSPFDRTIYLDTDTWVVDDDAISDLFEILDRFDLIAPREFGRRLDLYRSEGPDVLPTVNVPDAFPMYHAGIFGFEDNDRTAALRETWRATFERHVQEWPDLQNDQPAFREAIYHTDVNVGVFAPEYSFRLPFPQQVMGRVKIIHGRAANFPEVAAKLNKRTNRRICYPIHTSDGHPDGRSVDILLNPGLAERLYRTFRQSVREVGLLRTIELALTTSRFR